MLKGNHTTCIDLAGKVWDAIVGLPAVTGISLSFIDVMRGSSGSTRKVKIVFTDSGLRLTVKQGGGSTDFVRWNKRETVGDGAGIQSTAQRRDLYPFRITARQHPLPWRIVVSGYLYTFDFYLYTKPIMLYVFYGDDTATTSKKVQATIKDLHKKRPDAEFFRVEGRTLSNDFFAEYTVGQGLFDKKYVVEIQYPFENADSKEVFLDNLSEMAESENVFLVLEGKMLAPEKKRIEKHAQKMLEHKKPAAGKPDFNLFSLADAVGSRNKKNAWVIYQKALGLGTAPEEIHGVIWWQMKTVYTTMVTKSATEAGIKDFSYNKSARFAEKYSKDELEDILQNLVSMYHDAHLGLSDFELSLEKFVLNI